MAAAPASFCAFASREGARAAARLPELNHLGALRRGRFAAEGGVVPQLGELLGVIAEQAVGASVRIPANIFKNLAM